VAPVFDRPTLPVMMVVVFRCDMLADDVFTWGGGYGLESPPQEVLQLSGSLSRFLGKKTERRKRLTGARAPPSRVTDQFIDLVGCGPASPGTIG